MKTFASSNSGITLNSSALTRRLVASISSRSRFNVASISAALTIFSINSLKLSLASSMYGEEPMKPTPRSAKVDLRFVPLTLGTTTPMMFRRSTSTSGWALLAIAAARTASPPSIALARSIRCFANRNASVISRFASIISARSCRNSWKRPSRFILRSL